MKKGWKKLLGIVVLLLLVWLIVLANRDPEDDNAVTFQATTIQAKNNSSITSAHSSSANNMFLARRIGVISESEHPVMREVAKNLTKELNDLSFVEQAELLSGENRPEPGALLHDLYIHLEMPEFNSQGLLATGRKVEAKIKGSIGRSIWNSRTRYSDHLSASLVDPYIDIELEHQSTSHGIESPNIKYAKVAENISEQINAKVLGQLNDYASKFHMPGSLPSGLYPDYHPAPDLPESWSERLVEVINGHGFMLHNYTIHSMMSDQPFEELEEARDLLKERGWRMNSKNFEKNATSRHRFRATLDHLALEAFEVRDGERSENEESVRLVFIYSDRMTQQEITNAFHEAYGKDQIPVEQWVVFERALPKEMNKRILDQFVVRNDLPYEAEKFVIRYLERNGRHDEAVARLKTASIKAVLHGHEAINEMKKLGRDITGNENWEPEKPTVEEFKMLGVTAMAVDEELEVEVSIGESTLLMSESGEESGIFNVTINRSKIPEGRYALSSSTYSLNGRSSQSSSTTPHSQEIPWHAIHHETSMSASWEIQAEEVGTDRFKLTIKRR